MSTVVSDPTLQERCIETIRFLAVDGVQTGLGKGRPLVPETVDAVLALNANRFAGAGQTVHA